MRVETIALLMALTTATSSASEYFTGDGTSYTLGQVSSGNCNFMSAISTASTNYVALNQEQWDELGNCGRCIEVSCIDEQCTVQNKTAVVQVLDRCPECAHGALDLSPTVYKTITGLDPNRLTVQWRFVDCPNPGTIEVCLKEGSNSYWLGVQPTNFVVGVESLTINGETPTMLDGAYYYILQDGAGVDLSAVDITITSINGDTIEGTYALTAGSCTDTKQQFSSSGDATASDSDTTTTTAPATTTAAPSTTAAPVATTATPASTSATTSAPSTTTSAPATGGEYDDDDDTSTTAPTSTTSAPTATTAAPATTTAAPTATTAAPAATTAAPATSGGSKCRVRSRK